jgi:hypothetical protein
MQLKQLVLFLLLVSCGFTLVEDRASVSFTFNEESYRDDINKKHLYKLITQSQDSSVALFNCDITDIKITNSRIATNSSGEDSSYKFEVSIFYQITNSDNQLVEVSSYSFVEIYQIDNSLYSDEVKNNELLLLVPEKFNQYLKQKLLVLS